MWLWYVRGFRCGGPRDRLRQTWRAERRGQTGVIPLVLLPGMMCDARLFAPQVAAFVEERDVIIMPISEHDSVEKLAAVVLNNAPQRFALAGLSMGGIVAMEVLAQATERVERIAFLDTNSEAEMQAVKDRRGPQIDKALTGHLDVVMREEMKPNYLTEGPKRGEILDLCMAMALDLGPEVFRRQSLALMNRPDQTDTLRRATLPALALCGRDDALCPIHRHERIAGLITACTLQIIDGAGHLPTLEQPEATNAALREWLNA
ncbi:MAG: alpha/beta hydrolase [Marinovum sp.]|nr:alpha/beta hydrolase [Marinovum sp.]